VGGALTTVRAAIYTRHGGPAVIELVERPVPAPAAGEIRLRVLVSPAFGTRGLYVTIVRAD
jgi:hypothetical protein